MNKLTLRKLTINWQTPFVLSLLVLIAACTPIERQPRIERSMGVSAGPDNVFSQPVSEIVPQLSNATATGTNGRVGNEMVFWGYRLQDNTGANLFACAMLDDVDCDDRIAKICPAGGQEQARVYEPGTVRHINCRPIGVAAPGDLLPNCEDYDRSYDLMVGLMQCQ